MRKIAVFIFAALAGLMLVTTVHANPTVIQGVPAYYTYTDVGCGPTAAGSIFGYYDLNGYPNLFSASGSDVYETSSVKDQLSSPEHYDKYWGTDDPNVTYEPNSIADWFETSVNKDNGWSNQGQADDAFIGYADYRGYTFDSWWVNWGGFSWQAFTGQIDAGRPMMFLVDSSGDDNSTDHFVSVIGYEDRGNDGLFYGFYDMWHESESDIRWEPFAGLSPDYSWGIGYATFVDPVSAPVPGAFLLFLSGAAALSWLKRRCAQPSTVSP